MEWDRLAEEKSQRLFAGWLKLLFREWPALPLKLARQHRPGKTVKAAEYTTGSCNICSTVSFEDGDRVVVRFPLLGRSRFRREKTEDELAVMTFLAVRTTVPVPEVLGRGEWAGGPYIVMSAVEGELLSSYMKDPDVCESDLRQAYGSMAKVVLDLSKPALSSIGGLVYDHDRRGWRVGKRPLTLNMNEMVRVGNVPTSIFADNSFSTTAEYFGHLADLQFEHLRYQRNDAVKDEEDCRKKYIARCLFRRIADRISSSSSAFHLYCDDLRPSNVLVRPDFTVTAVIDWEFAYFAPAEFTHAAPWWLLFESPEAWEDDLTVFLARYRPRLSLFLSVLRRCEDEQVADGRLKESQRLSGKMEQSMSNGVFWFCLAARKSYMFDDIYWAFLHRQFFGEEELVSLLTVEERDEMDGFVRLKMQQVEEQKLDEHSTFDEVFDM
ncbi:hypothetical protein FQN49_007095 [Arthroderma sp. PD_2]|nr:hypothetical protein FQN49_007095 [Arthroderma sp. PD_2]